ncbi:hypothetical protein GTS_50950 [Gandjariella thermophila]|uniref:Uncharacterized protein n=1 Tax=Gandjariella thermophila TaxID=1931992 RepID=A0A4D4JDH5_9PSEU|nr:hypothetical protein GTS_50950 [Gandjariella thermophila]
MAWSANDDVIAGEDEVDAAGIEVGDVEPPALLELQAASANASVPAANITARLTPHAFKVTLLSRPTRRHPQRSSTASAIHNSSYTCHPYRLQSGEALTLRSE